MLAENVMVKNVVTATVDESVDVVLERMREEKLRMLPVLDRDGAIVGVISTFSVMAKVVPSYISNGDLSQISYVPDIGVLRRHYTEIAKLNVAEVMDARALLVQRDESLLSVAAAMLSFTKHEYAVVVDDHKRLLGIVSAGDILERIRVGGEDA